MACALTQGYSIDCLEGFGGIKNAWFANFNDISAIVASSGDVITGLTKATGKKFYKYQLAQETSDFKDSPNGNPQNGTLFYKHELNIVLNTRSTAVRNEVLLLAKAKLLAVVEDRNGKYWMLGRTNGLDMEKGDSGSGKAAGDRNGFELTFGGEEPALAIEVNSTVATALETAG